MRLDSTWMNTAGVACGVAVITCSITGCASHTPSAPSINANLGAMPASNIEPRPQSAPATEQGLEVHQWLIEEDIDRIAAAMAARGTADLLDENQREELRRNGLRLVRVKMEDLASLEADLGGAALNHVGWHGQVLQWQEIITRPIPQQRALAIDGRVRMLEPGRVRLMSRAWIVPMEDGVFLNLQLVPQHYRAGPVSYYRLLGRETGQGETFTAIALDLLLEEGYAYVLTCESPLVDWLGLDDDEVRPDSQGEAASRSQPLTGPIAPTPTTLGQLMLRSERGRPGRGVLVFIPRIESPSEAGFTNMAHLLRNSGADSAER